MPGITLERLELVLRKGFKCGINLNKGTDIRTFIPVMFSDLIKRKLKFENMEQIKYVLRKYIVHTFRANSCEKIFNI